MTLAYNSSKRAMGMPIMNPARGCIAVRWAATAVLCFVLLGPFGPRKLLRMLTPVDRVALLSDTDTADDVQPGILPQVGCFLPAPRTHASVPQDDRPLGRDSRGRVESSRSPPA
jgi:hypothetical protein